MIKLVYAEQPAVKAVDTKNSVTLKEWRMMFSIDGVMYWLIIPAGFVFNGASIPRLLWTLLGLAPHGVMDGPALPHDFIYQFQGKLPAGSLKTLKDNVPVDSNRIITRSEADTLLGQLCEYFNINGYRSWMVWAGVRIGGWLPWMRDTKAEKKTVKTQRYFDKNILTTS